jgi:hypothetical protein
MGYGLKSLSSILGRNKIFIFHSVQTVFGAHTASYPMGTGDSFPQGKVAGV